LAKEIDEKPQKSLWIRLDFLVRIEPFQWLAPTPGALSFLSLL
jgi:hypothetical protein